MVKSSTLLKHKLTVQYRDGLTTDIQVLLAYVDWYLHHPEKNYYHTPISVWYNECEPLSLASFMPIGRVKCRCAQYQGKLEFPERPFNNGNAVVCIPISYTLSA